MPALAVALLIAAPAAHAASLILDFNTACETNCARQGLSPGTAGSGRIVLDDSGFRPWAEFGDEALVDFSFDFGGGITLDRAGAAAFSLTGYWEGRPDKRPDFRLNASASDDSRRPGPTFHIGLSYGPFFVSAASYCIPAAGLDCGVQDLDTYAVLLHDNHPAPQPVPLPAAGWLLAAGAGALPMLRLARARRSKTA